MSTTTTTTLLIVLTVSTVLLLVYVHRQHQHDPVLLRPKTGGDARAPPPPPPPQMMIPSPSQPTPSPVGAVVEALSQQVIRDKSVASLLQLGDLYRTGSYPVYKPNDLMARECFSAAAGASALDPQLAVYGRLQLENMLKVPIAHCDRAGAPLPTGSAKQAVVAFKQQVKAATAPAPVLLPPQTAPAVAPAAATPPLHVIVNRTAAPAQQARARPPPRVRFDAQNVHDSTVMAAVKKSVGTLKHDDTLGGQQVSMDTIAAVLATTQDMSPSDLEKANRVLTSLTTTQHGTFAISEQDALEKTWNRIQTIEDPTVRSNAVETLGKQLASAVENDRVVCSTGKVSRIIDSLSGIEEASNDLAQVRPIETLKQELGTLAQKVRETQLLGIDDTARTRYEQGSTSSDDSDYLVDRMKADFRAKALDTYVQDLGMAQQVVEPLIDMYSEGF